MSAAASGGTLAALNADVDEAAGSAGSATAVHGDSGVPLQPLGSCSSSRSHDEGNEGSDWELTPDQAELKASGVGPDSPAAGGANGTGSAGVHDAKQQRSLPLPLFKQQQQEQQQGGGQRKLGAADVAGVAAADQDD